MLKFLLRSWVNVTLLVVALMSGVLSIVREVALLYWPNRFHERTLFWACVRMAVVIAGGLLLCTEHVKNRELQRQLDKSKPRFDGQITAAFITIPKSWDSNGNEHFRLEDSLVFLRALAWNTVDMPPTSVSKCEIRLTIDGKQYVGSPAPYKIALQGAPPDTAVYQFDRTVQPYSDLLYLRKLPTDICFLVDGLECGPQPINADLILVLTDLVGKAHLIQRPGCDLQLGRISVMR